ncbi:MAG: GYD domain-containing protein [Anaerolineae bacterium]|jgi:uncharacterized protein with GYD domain
MARYILLMNLTGKALKDIKNAPKRIEESAGALDEAGERLVDFYTVMGPYDYIAIVEGPSDEFTLAQPIALGMAGYVRTTTLAAFTKEEYTAILSKLA